MLATPGPLPSGPEWAFEVKFDGIRLISTLRDGRLRLRSRNGKDLTGAFPELQDLAAALMDRGIESVTLDGELVARGVMPPTLHAIAPRIHRTTVTPAVTAAHPVTYMVFDVMELDGADLTRRGWQERTTHLPGLLADTDGWHRSEVFDDGAALWEATAAQGLEGVIAKRRDSLYQPGIRSKDWVKSVHRTTTDLVVIGWRPASGGRRQVGSLVLADAGDRTLTYAGSAGSGLTGRLSEVLAAVLVDIARTDAPVEVPPGTPPANWVEPALVVRVDHLGRTGEGQLRQPVIVAVRTDQTAADLLAGDA